MSDEPRIPVELTVREIVALRRAAALLEHLGYPGLGHRNGEPYALTTGGLKLELALLEAGEPIT